MTDLFFLKRCGLFFRPEANGYTSEILLAGIFEKGDVAGYQCVEDPPVHVIPANDLRELIEEKAKQANELLNRITPEPECDICGGFGYIGELGGEAAADCFACNSGEPVDD